MIYKNEPNEHLVVYELDQINKEVIFAARETDVTFIWNTGEQLDISVDRDSYRLEQHQIIFLSGFHKVDNLYFKTARMVRFSQPFYRVSRDSVSNGGRDLLSSGFSQLPIAKLDKHSLSCFEMSWGAFCTEMQEKGLFQKEMLQTILKQMLILASRNYNTSKRSDKPETSQRNLIQEFNYLVEIHFAEHRTVSFYASKLNKSPKTLANLFSTLSDRAPLNIIHDRIMAQAKRLINYTDQSIKEIAYTLGYDDIQTFSRFFKNKEGISPSQYREKYANVYS